MNLNLSYKNILQWAFALSPIPSYLPQYFSIMQQLASADDADNTNGNGPSTFDNGGSDVNICDDGANNNNGTATTATTTTTTSRMVERGGGDHYYLRKRNLPDSSSSSTQNISSIFSTSPTSDGAPPTMGLNMLSGSPSKSFDQTPNNGSSNNIEENNNMTDSTNKQLDAGLSVATVLLLLSSHLLRLLYFHGLILEEERPVLPIASAADELIVTPTITANNDQPARNKPSALQWDLLGQSLSMIVVQLMLLHAMMLLRRKQIQRQRKKNRLSTIVSSSNGDIAVSGHYHSSAESLLTAGVLAGSSPGSDHNNSSNDVNNDQNNNTSSYWQKKSRQLSRDTTAHFHNLFSPRNILQKHSFLEYLELLFLSSMAVKLVFDIHWYPMYRMRVVEGLKHTSICMESCLALPQMMRNYRNRTTEGLSVVMVGGWVAGDFFKLCYFLFSMIGSSSVDDGASEGGPNNNMFALGSLLSLSLDSIVGMQMAWWYPEPWALQWQQRIMRSVRHWKTNKDDDAGESLLVNNEQMMRGGLFAWIVRMFFRGVRGIRPPSNNTS